MKKIISLILSFILICSVIQIEAFAADANNVVKIEKLSALGIIQDMNSVEFEKDEEIIKKTFYEAIYRIMTDDEKTDANVITLLERYKIKVTADEFGDTITRREALGAVVCMMGYSYEIPTDDILLQVAGRLDVAKALSGNLDGAITVGETVNLLYAAAFNDMLTVSVKLNSDEVKIEMLKDRNALEYYRDIYEVKGYVNKNSNASIVDNAPAAKGMVYIDDEEFSVGETNAPDYLGMPVVSLVKYNDDDEGEILYIAPNEKYVTVTKIDAADVVSVDEDVKSIQYEYEDRTKTADFDAAVKVIYNGKNCVNYTRNDLMPEIGYIELIDSNNDKKIEVVKVLSYETILVDYVSVNNDMIKSKYNNSSIYLFDDYDDIYIEKDGKEATLADITTNNVILMTKSKSGSDELVKLYISDKQATGVIKNVNYSDKKITIDNEEYSLSNTYINELDVQAHPYVRKPEVGKSYAIYFDSLGNVAYAVVQSGSQYVYASKIWKDEAEEFVGLKAMNTEGEWKQYRLEKTLRYNKMSSKQTDEKVYEWLGGSSDFSQQLLKIELNSAGNIKKLETAELSSGYMANTFTKYQMPYLRIYARDAMTFGDDLHGTSDTKVFILPTDNSRLTTEAYVTGMSYFKLDSRYQVDAYDIDKFYRAPVIVYQSDDKSADSNATIIRSIEKQVINDEVKTVLECMQDGKVISFTIADSYRNLPEFGVGDVIKIAQNTLGEISYIEVLNRLTKNITKQYPDQSDPASIHKSNVVAAGTITDIGIAEEMFLADCGTFTARLRVLGSTQVYLYDGKEKKENVKKVALSDLMPGDNVYIYIGWAKVAVVYAMRNVQ